MAEHVTGSRHSAESAAASGITQIGSIAAPVHRREQAADDAEISLIFLSGGADSTAALVKMLQDTEDHVHVHHVRLMNRLGRQSPELAACYEVVRYCKEHYRDFDFTLSTMDLSFMNLIAPDVFHTNYIAGLMAASDPRIRRLVRCVIADDETDDSYGNRRAVARNIFRTLVPEKHRPDYVFPIKDMSKADVLNYLPADLLRLTWSCRTPLTRAGKFLRCGRCETCTQIRAALPTSHGVTEDWFREEVEGRSE